MKRIPLYVQVLLGLCLGFLFPYLRYWICDLLALDSMSVDWIEGLSGRLLVPLADLFIYGLKLLTLPLVLTSIIGSLQGLTDGKKLSRIGLRTMAIYLLTTLFASMLGLAIGNLMPFVLSLLDLNGVRDYLHSLTDVVFVPHDLSTGGSSWLPDNIFLALTDNGNMLFLILFTVLCAFALRYLDKEPQLHFLQWMKGINQLFAILMQWLMYFAPIGVFALGSILMSDLYQHAVLSQFLQVLFFYVLGVLGGLVVMTFAVYPLLLYFFTHSSPTRFMASIMPAQTVAFTASSSAVALPTSLRCAEQMGVSPSVAGFVLPLGASVNIDGTALYQSVAILFVAHLFRVPLSWGDQLWLLGYLTLSSIGVGGVPGASLGVTSVLLKTFSIPEQAISFLLFPDRILDMFRSITNITGDAMVAVWVDDLEKRAVKKAKN